MAAIIFDRTTDDAQQACDKLNAQFSSTAPDAHKHDGTEGGGAKIPNTNIDDVLDQTLVGGSNTGNNHQLLCWIVKKIKEIIGKTNWYDSGGAAIAANLVSTTDQDIGDVNFRAKTLQSDVATGTAPLIVASTTEVANLRSATATAIAGKTIGNANGNIPLSNGTVCTNLNADKIDGKNLVLVAVDAVVVNSGATQTINLRTSQQHNHYLHPSVYSNSVSCSWGTVTIPFSCNYYINRANADYDTLVIHNEGSSATFNYQVLIFE
jgi:hypothetical protein